MANTIKQKRGTSDPGASDLVVGELAINTTDGGVFTKTDGGTVVEVGSGGGGGASAINDLSDAVTYDNGEGIGLGTGALVNDNDTDNYNTALGYNAGNATTSGEGNVFVGFEAGSTRTTVGGSVCVGYEAGRYPNSYHITAIGYQALKGSSSGKLAINNTAVGYQAGLNASSISIGPGGRSVFVGYTAGKSQTTGQKNVFVGAVCGDHLTTGSQNILIGQDCGSGGTEYARRLTTGDNNIIIGHDAEASSSTVDNEITLGDANMATIRCNVQTISSLSDARDKTDVQELPEGLEFIDSLNPVKFQWQTRDGNGKDGTYEAGFIAQELQSAQQDADADYLGLVMDNNPDRLEASYGKLVPMLVKAIQELKSEVEQLRANV